MLGGMFTMPVIIDFYMQMCQGDRNLEFANGKKRRSIKWSDSGNRMCVTAKWKIDSIQLQKLVERLLSHLLISECLPDSCTVILFSDFLFTHF